MERYAAFLRGVMPTNAKMPELKRCFEAAGFSEVKTLLTSGNVLFSARKASPETLAQRAEAAMQEGLGRTFMTFVRSTAALAAMLDKDPYRAFPLAPESKRVISFLRSPPASVGPLPIERDGAQILAVEGREVFSAYLPSPKGPAFMKLLESTFGTEITTRTLQTVSKMVR